MIAKKLTKEEQEKKLEISVSKSLVKINKKPGFGEWLLHDKKAFKITYLMGTFGGVLVMLLLFGLAMYFDFDGFFKVLFGIMLGFQGWNTYKIIKNHKNMNTTINDIVYKGKNKEK